MINPQLIAFYFTQFHAIPENDEWWGKGFNDWELVKNAKPNFEGHNQPRVPLDGIYYNPCDKVTLEKQINLAKSYGIGGFMFYHYWFDGKLMLEKPLETLLNNKDLDFPFCICWANESWSRAWIGKPEVILQKQKHTPDDNLWRKHIKFLIPFLRDTRALKVDNKPIIVIYQPSLIQDTPRMFQVWKEEAQKEGIEDLYLLGIKSKQTWDDNLRYYDGVMRFQPREAYTSKDYKDNIGSKLQFLDILPEAIMKYLRKLKQRISKCERYNSHDVWQIILKNAYKNDSNFDLDIFESAFFEWDNTPRYGKYSKIFTGLNTADMESLIMQLYTKAINNNSPYLFFNAWNEWSESAYLEPDTQFKCEKLALIKRVFLRK